MVTPIFFPAQAGALTPEEIAALPKCACGRGVVVEDKFTTSTGAIIERISEGPPMCDLCLEAGYACRTLPPELKVTEVWVPTRDQGDGATGAAERSS